MFEDFRQPEISHLDRPAHEQEVLGFHVPVLNAERVEVVQPAGRVAQVLQQLRPRDARQPLPFRLGQAIVEGPVPQLQGEEEPAADPPGPEQGQEVGVSDILYHLERPLLGRTGADVEPDELQRHLDAVFAAGLPDLTEVPPLLTAR